MAQVSEVTRCSEQAELRGGAKGGGGHRAALTHLSPLYLQKMRGQLYQEEKANCEGLQISQELY